MIRITRIDEVRSWSRQARTMGRRVALVPTMGYLHEGHLALIREARRRADAIVVSLFVNPTQFGPNEDLDRYPRDPENDARLCAAEGVEVLFTPATEEMYPQGFQTRVVVPDLSGPLCGAARPGHFEGVATVVAKLFHAVEPELAIFGRKDFQQLQVIRRMVRDLDMPVEVHGVPTVREEDGLALSSRNAYLSRTERRQALCLWNALQCARERVARGESDPGALRATLVKNIEVQGGRVDYVEFLDPERLEPVPSLAEPTLLALAVFIGSTRLIDNCILSREQPECTEEPSLERLHEEDHHDALYVKGQDSSSHCDRSGPPLRGQHYH